MTNGSAVNGVKFNGHVVYGSNSNGINIQGGENYLITNCLISGYGDAGITASNVSNLIINNNIIGQQATFGQLNIGINIGTGIDNYSIQNNDLSGNVTLLVDDSITTATTRKVRNNVGADYEQNYPNLIPNSSFLLGKDYWNQLGYGTSVEILNGVQGLYWPGSTSGSDLYLNSKSFSVPENTPNYYSFKCLMEVYDANATVLLACFNSSGAFIGQPTLTTTGTTTGLQTYFGSVASSSLPSGTASFQISLQYNSSSTSGYAFFSQLQLQASSYTTEWNDDASLTALKNQINQTQALSVSSTTTSGSITATAAQLVGGYLADGATQTAAFTVTTDTAANILAQMPNAAVGTSFKFRFINNDQSSTGYAGTLAGGTGVTVGSVLPNPAVPKGGYEDYLFTFTAIGATPTLSVEAVGGNSSALL